MPNHSVNHVSALERKFDGPIPAHLKTAAEALDHAEAVAGLRPSARIRLASVRMKPECAAERMTDAARRIIDQRGELTERDLIATGFSESEVRRHGPAAVTAAKAALPARHVEAAA